MNLLVRGGRDAGIYCVDVGLTAPGAVPNKIERPRTWRCVENDSLLSFAEVKRLSIYPMLLAQFVGIVHEIKPRFLRRKKPSGFSATEHLPPTLVVLGRYSGNSREIVEGFDRRRLLIHVADNFDIRLAEHRRDEMVSPIY